MSIWDEYPDNYRASEVGAILAAVRAGACVSVVGLSGAGKSNLAGFLFHRCNSNRPLFILVDGNRVQPRTCIGLLHLIHQSLRAGEHTDDSLAAIEAAVASRLAKSSGGLCLLLDRFDALNDEERSQSAGLLRSLRDSFKYELTYVTTTRRPLDPHSELAELFFGKTLWLGPLSLENARWSALQFAKRHGLAWDSSTVEALIRTSWGYPALLRACCEAAVDGVPIETEAIRSHPAVQRRVTEFWADQPTADDLRRSGLAGQPILSAGTPFLATNTDLTASEHRLLVYFQSHPDQVCAKDDLIRVVWPEDRVIDGLRDDSLAQLIRRLRQKIEPDPSTPVHIHTVPGRGYRYTV